MNINVGERIPTLGRLYEEIKNQHGNITLKKCKDFAKYNKKLAKSTANKNFLIQCRKLGLTPKFITNLFVPDRINKLLNLNIEQELVDNNKEYFKMKQKTESLCSDMFSKLLNIVIREKCIRCTKYKGLLTKLRQEIEILIHVNISEYFFTSQREVYRRLSESLDRTHERKIAKLKLDMFKEMGVSFNPDEDWFVNCSDKEFPDEVRWLLSLGKKFALPHNKKDFPLLKVIADVENCIGDINDAVIQTNIRSDICTFLRRVCNNFKDSKFGKFINRIYKDTKELLSNNKDIIVTQADKGGKTVVLKKQDYNTKLLELITDRNTYRTLRKDLTISNQSTNNELVKMLNERGYIDEKTKKSLTTYNALPPRLYGLPKIHKEGIPLRPIVSSINSPSYNLSKYLGQILKQWNENSTYNIKNSFEFKNKIGDLEIGSEECMVSFDVISLFTSVPLDHFFKLIDKNWDSLAQFTRIPKDFFLKLLKFCLVDNNYFLSNDRFYRQVSGAPMGGPLSPIVADIVMEDLLKTSVNKLIKPPKILTKYVDDIFTVMDKNQVFPFLNILNSYHNNIRFTFELEKQDCLPYLDLMLLIKDGRIVTNWYRKPTSTDRLLNYLSCHPKHQILNTAKGLVRRILHLSDPVFHNENLKIAHNILKKNNFPNEIIDKLTKEVFHKFHTQAIRNNPLHDETQGVPYYRSVTYVPGISEYADRLIKRSNNRIRLGFSTNKNLGTIFTAGKDKVDKSLRSNVVYEVPCSGSSTSVCKMKYIGTTKQYLKNRMSNHKNDINAGRKDKSALASHCIHNKHRPGLDNVKILCSEKNIRKRFILESLYIQASDNTINVKQDIDSAHGIYGPLVSNFGK